LQRHNLLFGGIEFSVGNVFSHSSGEKQRVLENNPEFLPQALKPVLPDIDSINRD